MGCGCRKPKKTKETLSSDQLKKIAKASLMKSKAILKKAQLTTRVSQIERERLFICDKCSYSTQSEKDKINNIRICHKLNRPLTYISKNTTISCPIGNFTATK